MRVIVGYPPNFREIVAKFPAARGHGTLFAFGNAIYNPSNIELTPADIAHEREHCYRQLNYFGTKPLPRPVAAWWEKYLADPKFRFDEEVIAHRAEWAKAKECLKGNRLQDYLSMMANRLSGLLYGRMVSRDQALALITEEDA